MLSTNASRVDFHAKRYFLTYSQSGETTKEEIRDFLINNHGAEWYIIGREAHENGGHHIHAYIEWTRQKRIRDPGTFDYRGLHPNIQTVRSPVNCQAYCTKDGDYIANMEITRGKRTYGQIIASAGSAQEFMVAVEEAFPRDMVLHLDRITSYCNYKWPSNTGEYTSEFSTFVVPEQLESWVEDNVHGR